MNREIIGEFLLSEGFRSYGIVILSMIISVAMKALSRSDRHQLSIKNDFAVGIELTLTATILFITRSTDRSFNLSGGAGVDLTTRLVHDAAIDKWGVFTLMLFVVTVTFMVRKLGWNRKDDLNILWGVILPDIIGVVVLYVVFAIT